MPWKFDDAKPTWGVSGNGISVGRYNIPNINEHPRFPLVGVQEVLVADATDIGKNAKPRVRLEVAASFAEGREDPTQLPDAKQQFLERFKKVLKAEGIEVGVNAGNEQKVQISLEGTNMATVAEALEKAKLVPAGFAEAAKERQSIIETAVTATGSRAHDADVAARRALSDKLTGRTGGRS